MSYLTKSVTQSIRLIANTLNDYKLLNNLVEFTYNSN